MLGSVIGAGSEAMVPEAHELLACAAFHLGKYEQAIEHATRGLKRFRHEPPNELYARFGVDPAVYSHGWAAFSSWFLGRSADAAGHIREAAEGNATRPYAMASASVLAASFHQYRGEPEAVLTWSDNAIAFATEQGFPYPLVQAQVLRAWARVVGEGAGDRLAGLTAAIDAYRASGARSDVPHYLGLLADALLRCGKATEALAALDQALAQVHGMAGHFHEPELHRLRARALVAGAGDQATTEARAALLLGLAQAEQQRSAPMRLRLLLTLHDRVDDGPGVVAQLEDALAAYPADDDAPDVAKARTVVTSGRARRRRGSGSAPPPHGVDPSAPGAPG